MDEHLTDITPPSDAQFGAEVAVQFDVAAKMRDGVVLRSNIYRPRVGGPWPTLLTRLPYSKDNPELFTVFDPTQAARKGFLVVVQDTRGRFASEGEWEPFRFEAEDGFDSVEWAATLPGSNGRVGMYGESYFGNTQWMAAIQQPPSLAAISPALTWADPMDGLFARGGAVELGTTLPWTLEMGLDYLGRIAIDDRERENRTDKLIRDYDRLADRGYWELPVSDSAVLNRNDFPELGGIHALSDASIATYCRVAGNYDQVTVPTLHTGGWYDLFLQAALDNYVAMVSLGRDARLVVGPWSHNAWADPIGEQQFGLRGGRFGMPFNQFGNWGDFQLAWLRHHLTPDAEVALPEKPVKIFVMGRNEWRDESAWPLSRARLQRYFLRAGEGLTADLPAVSEPQTTFRYDPADPAPTVGGSTVMSPVFPTGPVDQRRVEARGDVCTFTSAALDTDLEVTGRVKVFLHAESSASATDWVARLCDVYPDGRSINLCDGILRLLTGAEAMRVLEIDLWSVSNVFLAGHRIRVAVTSSSFPRWDRNLNTGNQDLSTSQVATQRICHDAEYPSYVELPTIPSG